ncbi:Exodeoxyribonuclease [Candidatus Izimaplasma bacterium HR1]|jgi:exodeoxyribonuclease-3|uniref:exodeoxyribonuclease III n=1 Tax=Candidatus Izimoplasma sp. HR1 TaxID=1541959 RepID=UPI0004F8675F|nr:Exodeoxyribonuclease [Candidatus Izimaplasma bacterium HR1]
MKFVSWNVNGLRACMKKGFAEFFREVDADFFSIQETKMQENQKEFAFEGYREYWNDAEKKGYSGTLIYAKYEPLNVIYGLPDDGYNDEGRIITLEYNDFYLVNTYVPNSKRELLRLDYRQVYEDRVREYYKELNESKPVILCGDLNVAHTEIDLKNPKSNKRNAGFTIEERTKFTKLLDSGFTDTFRYLYPEVIKYSWWSYMFNARKNNSGWRIDYFVVSNDIKAKVVEAEILNDIMGSDHCPIVLDIEL